MHDHDVHARELIGDGVRHREDPSGESTDQEPLDGQRGPRLDHDLAPVPHVGPAREKRRRPAVPRVERVGVHDVDVESSEQTGEADDGDRPRQRVAQPRAEPVAARDALHRHDVDLHPRGFELSPERRFAGNDDVALEFRAWQAAHHSQQRLI